MDVLRHWGLRERPFETTFDPRFFYASEAHEEALARLGLLAEDGDMGFGLLTGEIGSGKTFAAAVHARSLAMSRGGKRFAPVFLTNSGFGYAGILDQLNCSLRHEKPTGQLAGRYQLLVEFRRLLESRIAAPGLHLVLILDEAQDLSDRDLVDLRGLLNTASAGKGLMTIVLVGQPELRGRVRALPTVHTRVGLSYHLRQMGRDEVVPYVLQRLRAAGHATGDVFSRQAVAILAERSRGVPREVNRIAKLALYAGAAAGARVIGPADVASIAADAADAA
jgi:type II secretory pathway predicted ATPase ExeA